MLSTTHLRTFGWDLKGKANVQAGKAAAVDFLAEMSEVFQIVTAGK